MVAKSFAIYFHSLDFPTDVFEFNTANQDDDDDKYLFTNNGH